MTFDWQTLTTFALIGIAAAYVGWRTWRVIFTPTKAGCGGCKSCPADETTLVSLEEYPTK